jgi:ElaB/YqjD/DUF883 family membrane-anchored ribosome-binding protein
MTPQESEPGEFEERYKELIEEILGEEAYNERKNIMKKMLEEETETRKKLTAYMARRWRQHLQRDPSTEAFVGALEEGSSSSRQSDLRSLGGEENTQSANIDTETISRLKDSREETRSRLGEVEDEVASVTETHNEIETELNELKDMIGEVREEMLSEITELEQELNENVEDSKKYTNQEISRLEQFLVSNLYKPVGWAGGLATLALGGFYLVEGSALLSVPVFILSLMFWVSLWYLR